MEKLNRLRQMSAGEIAWRVRERALVAGERARVRLGTGGITEAGLLRLLPPRYRADGDQPCSVKAYLTELCAARFYLPVTRLSREQLRMQVATSFPQAVARAAAEGARLCRHEVEILGHGICRLGPQIDWHRDPLTGEVWPVRFWASYDPVGDSSTGDVKRIHELNRMQHLPRLGKAWFLTGDERFAAEAVAQMRSWIAQNPPGTGINWQSSLEVAVRSLSWLWTVFFILHSKAFDEQAARDVVCSLLAQLDHVHRYPSRYSSPNTHLIGEAAALFIGGLVFEGLKRAVGWREAGAFYLAREIERQVHADGVYAELSTCYHCYALDFYLQALVLARRNYFGFPRSTWQRFGRMFDFVLHAGAPSGGLPRLGDDDGGRALALSQTSYGPARDLLAAGAVLFQRPDLKFAAGDYAEEAVWLLGRQGQQIFETLPATAPPDGPVVFPDAGYVAMRSGWQDHDSRMILDCGGLGLGNGGHGHADALSIVLSVAGREILADPGTFIYNGAPEWRNYFRSTAAHNTAVVDGQSQSEPGATFKWRSRAAAVLARRCAYQGLEYAEGAHDGYRRLAQPVRHRRRVLFAKPVYWLVLDEFSGRGVHSHDVYWHFAPGTLVCSPGASSDFIAGLDDVALQVSVRAALPFATELLCGRDGNGAPIQGWVSSRYGQKRAAPVLRAAMRAEAPCSAATVLAPLPRHGLLEEDAAETQPGVDVRILPLREEGALAVEIAHGHYTDLAVLSGRSGRVELRDVEFAGEMLWIRSRDGAPTQLLAIGARNLVHRGAMLLARREPTAHVCLRFWPGGEAADPAAYRAHGPMCAPETEPHVRNLRDLQLRRG